MLLLDGPHQAVECPLADWAPAELFALPGLPPALAKTAQAEPFRGVSYHNAAMDLQVDYPSRARLGYFVRVEKLLKALRKSAESAGVKIKRIKRMPLIRLQEDYVRLEDAQVHHAGVLLAAQDRPEAVLRELGQPARVSPLAPLMVAGLDVPLESPKAAAKLAGSLHVLECKERTELGLFFAVNRVLHLRIISTSSAAGTRAAELSAMVAGLQERRLLPADLPLRKAAGAVWYPPAGAALEMETHVAKRCLLAGTAGGFADTITGHSLYPSILSALLAAEAIASAWKSSHVQEKLSHYKNSWRKALADYLRPPNTSLQMLLPLLFVNQRIVSRFTRALLTGTPM